MKLVKLYESVLREGASESCVAEFGNILFGDQLGGNEKNTNIEDKHAKAVYDFTDVDFGENIRPEIQKAIINLKQCMSVYPEILIPKNEYVFRGTSAPIMEFIKNGKIPTNNEPQPFIYKAKSVVQSWTENINTAKNFGDGEKINQLIYDFDFSNFRLEMIIPKLSRITIPVIISHRATPKDFLFKSEYLNKLSEFGTEDEVIRVDNSPIEVDAYLNEKWLSSASRNLIRKINELL